MRRYLAGTFLGASVALIAIQIFLAPTKNDRMIWSILLALIPFSLVAAVGALAIMMLGVLVHEVGHLVAGRKVGLTFRAMYVGPVGILRKNAGGLQVRWMKNPFWGGLAVMDFPDHHEMVPRFRTFIRGGPVASLLWCTVTFGLVVLTSEWSRSTHSTIADFSFIFAMVLLLMAILILPGTLYPKPMRGMMTDAFLLRKLEKPGPEADRIIGMFQLTLQIRSGRRAQDWDQALIERGLVQQDGSVEELQMRLIAYYHALDRGIEGEALGHLERARAILPAKDANLGITGQAVLLESVYQAALHGDIEGAKTYGRRVKVPMSFVEATELRAKAALAIAEGRFMDAHREIEAAHKALRRLSATSPGDLFAEIARLDSLERKMEASWAWPAPTDQSSADRADDAPAPDRSSP